jgi:SNF2 family DNA or RNA helicase
MGNDSDSIVVTYDSETLAGRLSFIGQEPSAIWERLRTRAIEDPEGREVSGNEIVLPWAAVLTILREYGTRERQQAYGFRFKFDGQAEALAKEFAASLRRARESRLSIPASTTPNQLEDRLRSIGFTKRVLRWFQLRDLARLSAIPHGANFSVPGAGKTTVTLALHMLVRTPGLRLFVVAPKSAFPAWMSVVDECIGTNAPQEHLQQFTILDGSAKSNERCLRFLDSTRYLITYDLMIRQQSMLASVFSTMPMHIVLDEAHRMKAGTGSRRGAFLLNVSPLFVRRDILTGTPMPQGPEDLASQLAFLWPGHGLDIQVQRGDHPRDVLGELYARTTKTELGLPPAKRHFIDVPMLAGQMALYGVVRNETLRRFAAVVRGGGAGLDFLRARRSVMRLLQISANPTLALRAIAEDLPGISSGIVDAVVDEGVSQKIRAVMDHIRALASEGRKVVLWTIFTGTIADLEVLLADLNPVTLFGAVPSGSDTDLSTREGRLRRFHHDPSCKLLIANPAAAGEGISLHTVCHDAIYLDRTYVSTHYLQSIDRIHRLGLEPGVETNIYIYRTKAPPEIGSIDYSVSRRLATKIRGLQQLLDDKDLHQLALDEESAEEPIDYSVGLQDLIDLVEELEGKRRFSSEDQG